MLSFAKSLKSTLHRASLAALLVMSGVTASNAFVIGVTYSGVISAGYDQYGWYGLGQNLAGQSFVLNFSFNSDHSTITQTPASLLLIGGSLFDSPAIATAELTIDSQQYSYTGFTAGYDAQDYI